MLPDLEVALLALISDGDFNHSPSLGWIRQARFEQQKCKCPGVCVFPNNVKMKSFLRRLGDLNSAVASACFVFSFGSCAFEPFEELRFL